MRKHFASGLVFIIVAVLSVAAGLLMVADGTSQLGFVFLFVGGFWFVIAIAIRNRSRNAEQDDEKGPGPAT
jgi:predicted membrane channel-forming protein YqfA (hemolysin III family)